LKWFSPIEIYWKGEKGDDGEEGHNNPAFAPARAKKDSLSDACRLFLLVKVDHIDVGKGMFRTALVLPCD